MDRDDAARISRRGLIASAAGLALAGAFGGTSHAAPSGRAVEVLTHDATQAEGEFRRGRVLGARLSAGALQGPGLFESEPIASPFPFTHVGLHWRGAIPAEEEARFEVRTSLDGDAWTSWRALALEAGRNDTPSGETFASLAGAQRHTLLQYRVFLGAGASLSGVTATFINSADGPVKEQLAAAVAANPAIDVPREAWGCDESLRFRGRKEIWPRMFVPVKKLVLHHTASERYLTTDAEVEQEVRAIYTYHARTLGWGDIGYSALIGLNGKSYEGRYGRGSGSAREVFNHDVVAGHALDHNYGSCGVALIGYFHSPLNHQPTQAMLGRLLDVFEQVGLAWEIDPVGRSSFLTSSGAWNRGGDGSGLVNLCGHRDCNSTACPGDIVYALLDGPTGLREQLRSRLQSGSPLLEAPAPLLNGADAQSTKTSSLAYSWSGGNGTLYSYYLEGWYKSSRSESITYLSGFDADRRPRWSAWSAGPLSVSYPSLNDGHYTFHVRSKDADGNVSYQANKTVHII